MQKLKRCTKCFGRGFYLKIGGYTTADRVTCTTCGGSGQIEDSPSKPKKKYVYRYKYRGKNDGQVLE
jgi:DnaJ-class molecular chaperone